MAPNSNSILYQVHEINALPHIGEAKDLDLQKSAEIIGRLFAKHNLESKLAVTRLHNHYPLQPGEKIVIRRHSPGEEPRGYEKNPSKVLVKQPLQCDNSKVVPCNFIIKESGEIFAVEFMEIELANTVDLAGQLDKLLLNKAFMDELVNVMIQQNLWNKLGFQFIFEQQLLPENDLSFNLMEDNWDSYQEIMYRPHPSRELFAPTITSWRFIKRVDVDNDEDDMPFVHGDCSGYCWCLMLSNGGHGGHAWHSLCE